MAHEIPETWTRHGLLLLCGAGLSMASPSNVPSWWEFNEKILEGIKRRALDDISFSPEVSQSIQELTLDRIDLLSFSQVIHDAFAGGTWFSLLPYLDGEQPNYSHWAVAALAQAGIITTVLTTNFDTLLERAANELGVAFEILVPGRHTPPDPSLTGLKIVKLHGGLGETATLVDLATQKCRGFTDEWIQWIIRECESHSILVAGFSGLDLDISADYIGLLAAASSIPSLTWLAREPGNLPVTARKVIAECGQRATLTKGVLPDYLMQYIDRTDFPEAKVAQKRTQIEDWLKARHVDPLSCAAAVGRLLLNVGDVEISSSLRRELRQFITDSMRKGVDMIAALSCGLALHQMGTDSMTCRDFENAARDLKLSAALQRKVIEDLDGANLSVSQRAVQERRENFSGTLANLGMVLTYLGWEEDAKVAADEAEKLVESIPENFTKEHRMGTLRVVRALLALGNDHTELSIIHYTAAAAHFRTAGDHTEAKNVEMNLERLTMRGNQSGK
ncbi:SIR2 family protein [Nocardia amamiensis]|uniref:SIR2 family protein n=1 Tax=Nocardia amamiensis TaxID=404578 RepID=UPI0033CCEC6E